MALPLLTRTEVPVPVPTSAPWRDRMRTGQPHRGLVGGPHPLRSHAPAQRPRDAVRLASLPRHRAAGSAPPGYPSQASAPTRSPVRVRVPQSARMWIWFQRRLRHAEAQC